MNTRLQRQEFFTLYNLYLRKTEEFRQAVHEGRGSAELDGLRASLQEIYQKMAEKRGVVATPLNNNY